MNRVIFLLISFLWIFFLHDELHAPEKTPYVILISVDGLRSDYVEMFGAKNLEAFSNAGVWAESMLPVFPSSTFPNHYSIATGMYPKNHGIVSNEFYSRERNQWYSMKDKDAVTEGSWYGGEPIWSLVESAGMRSATYFWVGSEAEISGRRPTYYFDYDGKVSNQDRFDQAYEWLILPEGTRPNFISLYFSTVDQAGSPIWAAIRKNRSSAIGLGSAIRGVLGESK